MFSVVLQLTAEVEHLFFCESQPDTSHQPLQSYPPAFVTAEDSDEVRHLGSPAATKFVDCFQSWTLQGSQRRVPESTHGPDPVAVRY